jgi:hypothetical protein
MSHPIWKGTKQVFSGREFDLVPGVGMRVTDRWEGERSRMAAKAFAYYRNNWNVSCRRISGTPVWTCEASAEGDPSNPDDDSNAANVHELMVNVLNPHPLENAFLISKFAEHGPGENGQDRSAASKLQFVHERYNEWFSRKITYGDAYNAILNGIGYKDWPFGDATDLEKETARQVLVMLYRGVNQYLKFQFVYRHTFNYGTIAQLRADLRNVGAVFTSSELIRTENIPTSGLQSVQIPNGYWLKMAPTQEVHLGQRKTLTYEYWWGEQWERLLYPVAT